MRVNNTLTYESGNTAMSFTVRDGRLVIEWSYNSPVLLPAYAGLTSSDTDSFPAPDTPVGDEMAASLVSARVTYLKTQKSELERHLANLSGSIEDLETMQSLLPTSEVVT